MPMEEEDETRLVVILEKELAVSLERNRCLEKENDQLKQELLLLKAQLAFLRTQNSDRRSGLLKKGQVSISSTSASQQKSTLPNSNHQGAEEKHCLRSSDSLESTAGKERLPRVPKPPPRPTSTSPPVPQEANGGKAPPAPPPPPPPPLPSKLKGRSTTKVCRVPEVVEFYRSLTRRDSRLDTKNGTSGIAVVANARNMIGEIENRSTYLLAIKSDVETQGEFVGFLTREVENAAYREISDVEAFVKWLDEELSYLVDERAVLKHFPQWPEQKADAMREAAFGYRDLKNLESEVSSFRDNPHQPTPLALKRMQTLQDRLERSVHNMERMRETASKRYKEYQIPCEWMLDSGIIGQLKSSSMRLAKEYMKRVAMELQSDVCNEEDLMLQGVRFAFRIHQFAGGFDAESMHAFQELRKMSSSCHSAYHKPENILYMPKPC